MSDQLSSDGKADQAQFDEFARGLGFEKIFNSNYQTAYRAFTDELLTVVKEIDPVLVIDLGCGDGWTAELLAANTVGRYIGIDPSIAALEKLACRVAKWSNLDSLGIGESGEWLLNPDAERKIVDFLGAPPNLFICNTTCHQMKKAYPDVAGVLKRAIGLLGGGGRVLIGNYYYDPSTPDDVVEASRDWIRRETGQNATVRSGFFQPDEMQGILREAGVEIVASVDVLANPNIDLRYYVFRGQKKALCAG